MRANRVDANSDEVVSAIRAAGYEYISTTAMPEFGADGLALKWGKVIFIEIKDGAKSASRRTLTAGEKERKAQCERANVFYLVVLSAEDALAQLGNLRI